jgi:3',5'-cyclic-AMP phosphodiesterase
MIQINSLSIIKQSFSAVLIGLFMSMSSLNAQKYDNIKIGLCTDAHVSTMHDSEYRITKFIDSMEVAKPDFIIELGDFEKPQNEYEHVLAIWNSFPGDKYHVIGNHELDGGLTVGQVLQNMKMDKPYYSFDKNGFHFIVLNGNGKKDPADKGYKRFIDHVQVEWLRTDLAKTSHPVVIFSHQPLAVYKGPDEEYEVENYSEIQRILEQHNSVNPGRKVIACFNGHTHTDSAEKIDGIWYISITSMSYHWLGEKYATIRYSDEVDKNFKWIKYTAPFSEPLFTVIEISSAGYIKIKGKKTEWVGPSPFDLGYPVEYKKYLKPAISERTLDFTGIR